MNDEPVMSMPRKILLVLMIGLAGLVFGHFSRDNWWWPSHRINNIKNNFTVVFSETTRPWFMSMPPAENLAETFDADALAPGLVLVSGVNEDHLNFIQVVDRAGEPVFEVLPSWFEIWGDEGTFPPEIRRPQREPGSILHGVEMLPDGDLVFNFEHLTTIRMTPCGEVVWKLPNLGHHFVHLPEDGTIWVGSERNIGAGDTGYPLINAPLTSWIVQQLSPEGETLYEVELLDVFEANGLRGLMYLASLDNDSVAVSGDTLHLNDADIFPSDMESEVFEPGDIMVSLRNINAVMVFDPDTLQVKFLSIGKFLRQHDADFAEGDKIRVFDNNNMDPLEGEEFRTSRIVELDARTGEARTYFQGEGAAHFYSPTMGRQQLLENGNLFLTAPRQGRAMEVSPQGELLWQYYNILTEEFTGMLTEAHVLPQYMDKAFFENRRANCAQ